MIERISAPVTVISVFNHKTRKSYPYKVKWEGQDHTVSKVGLHHSFREGKTLHHVYSVACGNLEFRLDLNTDNLFWRLEEVSDGQPN